MDTEKLSGGKELNDKEYLTHGHRGQWGSLQGSLQSKQEWGQPLLRQSLECNATTKTDIEQSLLQFAWP